MYVIGLDVGTTRTKATLFDIDGTVVATAYREYPLLAFSDGGIEQRAQDWWSALVDTIKEVSSTIRQKDDIRALSISTQGGSCVLTDKDGNALANVQSWMDARPAAFLDKMDGISSYFRSAIGRNLSGMQMLAPRALWYQEKEPDLWKRAERFLTTADYLNLRLTGNAVTDQTNAAATFLYNMEQKGWDHRILEYCNIKPSMMSDVIRSGERVGNLKKNVADELDLSEKTIVASGAQDQYASAVGAGAMNDGDVILGTGTSWVVLAISDHLEADSYIGYSPHAIDGKYGIMKSLSTGGIGMEWFKRNFFSDSAEANTKETFKQIDAEAQKRLTNSPDLFFFPYFNGQTFPHYKPDTRASFMGVSLHHDKYDLGLAIMEGVVFDAALILKEFRRRKYATDRVKFIGGASKSHLWTSILQNVIGLPIEVFRQLEVGCAGAAAFAAVAAGMSSSIRDAAALFSNAHLELIAPSEDAMHVYYQAKSKQYEKLLSNIEAFYEMT